MRRLLRRATGEDGVSVSGVSDLELQRRKFYASSESGDSLGMVVSLRDGATAHADQGEYNDALVAARASLDLARGHQSVIGEREVLASDARLLQYELYADLKSSFNSRRSVEDTGFTERADNIVDGFRRLHKNNPDRRKLQFVDQYRIIFGPRLGAVELRHGSRFEAFKSGIGSIVLALVSESPMFVTNTATDIGAVERYCRKARHLVAGSLLVGASVVPEAPSEVLEGFVTR